MFGVKQFMVIWFNVYLIYTYLQKSYLRVRNLSLKCDNDHDVFNHFFLGILYFELILFFAEYDGDILCNKNKSVRIFIAF